MIVKLSHFSRDPDLPPETREAPPGPVGLSVVARSLAPLVINHSIQNFL